MKLFKRRIAGYLCALIAFTSIFCATSTEEAKASVSTYLRLCYSEQANINSATVYIEKGAKYLNIGDYISGYTSGYDSKGYYVYNSYNYISNCSGVKYSSSNQKVLYVNGKTGEAAAKKTGSAIITVKYKGAKIKFNVSVVKSLNSYKKNYSFTANSNVLAAAESLIKIGKNGINAKNKHEVLTKQGVYTNRKSQFYSYPSAYSTAYKYTDGSNKIDKIVIVNPIIQRAAAVSDAISKFASQRNPFSSYNTKAFFDVVKVEGKGNTVKVVLKKAVTENNIYGIQYVVRENTKVANLKKVTFPIRIREDKSGLIYTGAATATLNSKTIVVNTKALKMKKGGKYTVLPSNGDWINTTNGVFKAK